MSSPVVGVPDLSPTAADIRWRLDNWLLPSALLIRHRHPMVAGLAWRALMAGHVVDGLQAENRRLRRTNDRQQRVIREYLRT